MPEPYEIHLNDHSRIRFDWLKNGGVSVQQLRPQNMIDGHGLVVCASGSLEGAELQALLASLTPPEEGAPA